jgi:hypothetical protein
MKWDVTALPDTVQLGKLNTGAAVSLVGVVKAVPSAWLGFGDDPAHCGCGLLSARLKLLVLVRAEQRRGQCDGSTASAQVKKDIRRGRLDLPLAIATPDAA